jgi:hypothetical protein
MGQREAAGGCEVVAKARIYRAFRHKAMGQHMASIPMKPTHNKQSQKTQSPTKPSIPHTTSITTRHSGGYGMTVEWMCELRNSTPSLFDECMILVSS